MSLHVANVNSWLRVWRTTRHLRSSQIVHRLKRLTSDRLPVRKRRHHQRVENAQTPGVPTVDVPIVPEFSRGCVEGYPLVEALRQGRLRLVNRDLPFLPESPDWRLGGQREDRLWAITLHYHAWLYELSQLIRTGNVTPNRPNSNLPDRAGDAACYRGQGEQTTCASSEADALLRSMLHDWLGACGARQPGTEALAWNSYAIATRLGWWARIWHSLGKTYWQRNPEFGKPLLQSMHAQAVHLAAHLEWDLRANHLLRDAVGLAWAGRFFQGSEATRWLELADRIAVTQAGEQMLDDGGHFERSPFYHLEVMDDWLALARLLPAKQSSDKMLATWRKAAEYAHWLCHPDGHVAQFNDGAATIGAEHLLYDRALSRDIRALPPSGGRWFEDSGVITWHGDPWTVFWDVGEIGPDYQPGHAHADTLTLEASYRGRRLFVDPGSHSYDNDARRDYDRSTQAHNTVCIDQQDSSEVWHIFRVGRRARPRDTAARIHTDELWARAAHDGYDHLSGGPRHTRTILVRNQGAFHIVDMVEGQGSHTVDGGFLLAPKWRGVVVPGGWELTDGEATVQIGITSNRKLTTSLASHPIHPDYGLEQETQRICWSYQGELPVQVTLTIEPISRSLP